MSTVKISAAISWLSDEKTKGVLPLNEVIDEKTVLSILKEKDPQAKTANTNYITEVSEDTMPYHPSIFEQINAKTVRKSTLKTYRSHGPSGPDACEWSRILTHFNQKSIELCKTIAKLSYAIATKVLHNETLTKYNTYRLIPLDKNQGVRPIGMGEVLRKIIGKTITQCIKSDLKNLGKSFQLCLGQKFGIEYAIHSLRNEYEKPEADAILLIDAEIAFNSLNRELALKMLKPFVRRYIMRWPTHVNIPQINMSITRF